MQFGVWYSRHDIFMNAPVMHYYTNPLTTTGINIMSDKPKLAMSQITPAEADTAPAVTPANYYDETVKFFHCRRGPEMDPPGIDVNRLMGHFQQTHNIRYTIPVVAGQRSVGPKRTFIHSGIWETVQQKDNGGWAVFAGTASGGRITRNNILSARHDIRNEGPGGPFWRRGRHTYVSVVKGSLITMIKRHGNNELFVVFQVDDILPWSSACELQPSRRFPAGVANVSAIYAYSRDQFNRCFVTPTDDIAPATLAGILQMHAAGRDLLYNASTTMRYIEHFTPVVGGKSLALKREKHLPDNMDVQVSDSASCFLGDLYARITEYRQKLHEVKSPGGSCALPINVQHSLHAEDPNKVNLLVYVNAVAEGIPGFAVSTTLEDTIPDDLLGEPNVLLKATSLEGLRSLLQGDVSSDVPMFLWM